MDADQENEIVNASTDALLKGLAEKGRPATAVVTVVFFDDDTSHIATSILPSPGSDEDGIRRQGDLLMDAADLLDSFVHEEGMCPGCSEKGGDPD